MQGTLTISEPDSAVKRNLGGWERCPRQLIHSDLPGDAVKLYLLLLTFDGPNGCFPAQHTLWSALKCSKRTLNYLLTALESAGYVNRTRRWVDIGEDRHQRTHYTIHDEAILKCNPLHLGLDSEVQSTALQASEVQSVALDNASEVQKTMRVKCNESTSNCDLGTETISCSSPDERESDFTLEAEPKTPALKSRAKTQALGASQGRWFAEFWNRYPRKIAKGDAEKTFRREVKSEADFALMLSGLERDLRSGGPLDKESTFQPYPATWINRKDWQTPVEVAKPAQSAKESIKAAMATDTAIDWSTA